MLSLALLVPAALLLSAPCAFADPVAWSYSGSVSTHPTYAGDRAFKSLSPVYWSRGSWSFDHLARLEFEGLSGDGSGSEDVAAFRIRSSASDPNGGGVFLADNHTFTLTFGVADKASGASGTLTFQGALAGGMGFGIAHVTGAFSGPASQSVQLGEHLYTVTVSPFSYNKDEQATAFPPPWHGPYLDVQVSVAVSDVPEPSALALAALGLPALTALTRRRRRTSPCCGAAS
jgi:hypothetical protein